MESPLVLTTDRTHLFPGARLRADGPLPEAAESDLEAVVLFSDGVRAEAGLRRDGPALRLRVQAHRTAAGTGIRETLWELAESPDGTLRVLGRADGP